MSQKLRCPYCQRILRIRKKDKMIDCLHCHCGWRLDYYQEVGFDKMYSNLIVYQRVITSK